MRRWPSWSRCLVAARAAVAMSGATLAIGTSLERPKMARAGKGWSANHSMTGLEPPKTIQALASSLWT